MKYYIDTEFIEGSQKNWFGKTKPTIDLISIGIVAEDGREYYAISKDFNLKEAWNRCDVKQEINMNYEPSFLGWADGYFNPMYLEEKDYWIRDNVLQPIHYELSRKETGHELDYETWCLLINKGRSYREKRHYKTLKKLINKYGKSNQQIAKEVIDFMKFMKSPDGKLQGIIHHYKPEPEFYGYYADYDWVAFCWLFGRMVDLPDGFPMYCRDLKQMLDEKAPDGKYMPKNSTSGFPIKEHQQYPKQENEHSAIHDARWNKKLHEFIIKL